MLTSVRRSCLVLLAGLLVAAAGAPPASAKTFEVTRHNDPPPGKCKPTSCSVREAIHAANAHPGKDTVVLPDRHPRYRLSRPNVTATDEEANARGDLDVTGPVTIRHGGRGMATIDAQGIDRVLDVQPGAATNLVRIKATGGDHVLQDPPAKRATSSRRGPLEAGDGGGIFALAPLELVRSAVVANSADTGGGIEAKRLTLIRTRVSHNKTLSGTSGGIDTFVGTTRIVRSAITHNHAANAGGGIAISDGKLRMSKSTVAGNVADAGVGGVYPYQANVRITQSTISGNVAKNSSGGGISETLSKLVIINSTVTGNRADTSGGGIESSISGGEVSLNSVTVARNVADVDNNTAVGGGIFNDSGAATWSVVNSIVALNHSPVSTPDDCNGPFTSGGGNLIGNTSGCTGFGAGDLLGMGPKLGQLKNNGGPTKTLALKQGSLAIGKAKKSAAPKRDQRGRKRDGHPDIGAFERLP